MKYAWIKRYSQRYAVKSMCKLLEVGTTGYYDWLRRKPSQQAQRREELKKLIVRSFQQSYKIYGYRKVHQDLLQEHKVHCCKETVRKIMRANFLRSKVRKKFIRTTDRRQL